MPKTPQVSIRERFWAKVNTSGDCWLWTAAKSHGYGLFWLEGSTRPAHRVSFEFSHGPMDPNFDVDHMCHNRACVNPDHLRAVTNKQNLENRSGAQANSKSGIRGVSWYRNYGKWRAHVIHNGRQHFVGYFASSTDAESAVIAKRNELFTHNDADRAA